MMSCLKTTCHQIYIVNYDHKNHGLILTAIYADYEQVARRKVIGLNIHL